MIKNFILKYFGYDNIDNIIINMNYKDTFLSNDGIMIKRIIDGYECSHYIEKDYINNLLLSHRNNELSNIINDENSIYSSNIEWKIGDICSFEYKNNYVKSMTNDRITECNDGYGGTGSYDLRDRCFKLSPRIIRISEHVNFYYNWLSSKEDMVIHKGYIINYADIHRILVDMWVNIINDESYDNELILNQFGDKLIKSIENKKFDFEYDRIKMFKKRSAQLLHNKVW